MARTINFIPRENEEFDSWFKNLCCYTIQKTCDLKPEWTHVPAGRLRELESVYADWFTAWVVTRKPHSPEEAQAKDEARAAAENAINLFAKEFLLGGLIPDMDCLEIGIPTNRAEGPDAKPDGYPEQSRIDKSRAGSLTIHFEPFGWIRTWPEDVRAAEIRWAILDKVSFDRESYPNSALVTASPFTITFDESERGRDVYFCFRWESRNGVKGDFSNIGSSVIP
jgi:hypothetical protein